ncbi:hypothetical protein BS47DRAFT_1376820 [Hydnum rufescens UP504]|uniref:L-serine ammonia-lyase n=1 Tax=Hydnum rufescens UP504 TaxID=1448309 RepID=A0A9P6AW58_9AGAM|nr:hypothetical protein BS47DRAFT_1376820 [Hydnum rufescens UP504]
MASLWHETPLLYSDSISSRLGCDVYLKLETFQPPQSFKYRGQSLFVQEALSEHGPEVHLVIASGGNAALALAHACCALQVRCTVFITEPAARKAMLDSLSRLQADVIVFGQDYVEALREAEGFAATDEKIVMVPAYDHPILWKGISSMISEIAEQLPEAASPPDAILCSVGGGSLLGGTLLGSASQGWDDVHVVALETQGGDSFYHLCVTSTVSSEHGVTIATFSAVTTLATSLAATASAGSVIKMAVDHRENGRGGLTCVTVPDELSMYAALEFADEHKLLVELAASTTLTPIYSPVLFDGIFGDTLQPVSGQRRTLVFIVCGGSKVSLADMASYRAHLEQMDGTMGQAWVDGFAVAL